MFIKILFYPTLDICFDCSVPTFKSFDMNIESNQFNFKKANSYKLYADLISLDWSFCVIYRILTKPAASFTKVDSIPKQSSSIPNKCFDVNIVQCIRNKISS